MFITYNSFYFSVHLKLLIINGKRKVEFKQAFINCTNSNIPSTDLGIYKESWAPKDWCFWTMVLEKTLESPLDCKEIQPVHPEGDQSWVLEGLMLKLKLQSLGHLIWRADSFEKTLMLGKVECRRRRGGQRVRWLDGITAQWTWVWVDSRSWWWTGWPGVLRFVGHKELDTTERLNWFRHWSCSHWFF